MKRLTFALVGLAIAAAAGFILFAGPVLADTTTVAVSPATVAAAPAGSLAVSPTVPATPVTVVSTTPIPTFLDNVLQILETALIAILTAASPIVVYYVTKWFGAGTAQVANNLYAIAIDQAKGIVMHTIANSPDPAAAGNVTGMTTGSAPIVVATNYAVANYPAAFTSTGATPAEFAQDLLAAVSQSGGIIGTVAGLAGDVVGLLKKK